MPVPRARPSPRSENAAHTASPPIQSSQSWYQSSSVNFSLYPSFTMKGTNAARIDAITPARASHPITLWRLPVRPASAGAGVWVAATPVTLSGRSGGSPWAAGSDAGGTGLSASLTASAAGGEAPVAASTGSIEGSGSGVTAGDGVGSATAEPFSMPVAAVRTRWSKSWVSRWRTSRAVSSRPGSPPSSHSPSCHTAPRRWSATSLSTALSSSAGSSAGRTGGRGLRATASSPSRFTHRPGVWPATLPRTWSYTKS